MVRPILQKIDRNIKKESMTLAPFLALWFLLSAYVAVIYFIISINTVTGGVALLLRRKTILLQEY